jgi:hypothetical protein
MDEYVVENQTSENQVVISNERSPMERSLNPIGSSSSVIDRGKEKTVDEA